MSCDSISTAFGTGAAGCGGGIRSAVVTPVMTNWTVGQAVPSKDSQCLEHVPMPHYGTFYFTYFI